MLKIDIAAVALKELKACEDQEYIDNKFHRVAELVLAHENSEDILIQADCAYRSKNQSTAYPLANTFFCSS